MTHDELRWRTLLANSYCGALYTDDGELQDNTFHPAIDFKRDSLDEIEDKMRRRAASQLAASALVAALPGVTSERPHLGCRITAGRRVHRCCGTLSWEAHRPDCPDLVE